MSGCHGVAGRQLLPPQTQLIIEIRIIWHCDPAQSAAQQPSSPAAAIWFLFWKPFYINLAIES